jgi:succinate dehydrogenase / fumarate reductase flavoprotein subunit
VPKRVEDCGKPASEIPEEDRDYYLERKYPAFGNLVPRDIASRNAKLVCDEGRSVVKNGLGVYLDFTDAIKRLGRDAVSERYGNLFDMYQRITDDNPYETPMKIYPAVHYTMGGLWVDYNLQSSIPGCFVIGEANFSDHGANRLGASALMQGLADGYFVVPYTLGNYLGHHGREILSTPVSEETAEVREAVNEVKTRISTLLGLQGSQSPDSFHKRLGQFMWEYCGMARNESGLKTALEEIPKLREEFWNDVRVLGNGEELNQSLEKAGRIADFLELGELMCRDALMRAESCGGHFREESQTPEGEALRKDDEYSFVGAWEYKGENQEPVLHKEELTFNYVKLAQRSYK